MSDTAEIEEKSRPRGSVKFDQLLLDGFKSFADRHQIDIEPGLTGVVGPNGCGKSNLLEGLKWALGETSAKRMRGAQMDDVIFAGTERRPARNTAEVTLVLDNRHRTASAELNDADVLQLSRRIERGQGTSYRVNGRGIRQRDAQILFQDHGVGATSSAIVSQGRVSALINAKPSERRSVLEEAAGVSGLAARRHDSELKLEQTNTNLQRADDAIEQSSALVGTLRRQARQAQRRREIDDLIRQALAVMLAVRLREAKEALSKAELAHAGNEEKVTAAMIGVNEATAAREAAIAAIPGLREARTLAETNHARAAARLESVSNETERHKKELEEAERRMIEAAGDRTRDEQTIEEAERTIRRLQEEQMEIADKREGEGEALETASDRVDAARAAVEEADIQSGKLSEEIATREASRAALVRRRDELQKRLESVEQRLAGSEAKLSAARAAMPEMDALSQLAEKVAETEGLAEALSDRLLSAEAALEQARIDDERLGQLVTDRRASLTRLKAEAGGLSVVSARRGAKQPVAGMISVEPGYEAAVAAALGAALEAGLDPSESQWWVAEGSEPSSPPAGMRILSEVVSGVEEISRATRAVVVVDADVDLPAAAASLPAGFIAVSKAGGFMRWDGFRGRPGASSVEADLKRANRLKAIEAEIATLEPAVAADEKSKAVAQAQLADARRIEGETRSSARTTGDQLKALREQLATLERAGEENRRRLAVAESETAGVRAERQTSLADIRVVGDELSLIPEDADAKAQLQAARGRLVAAREAESISKVALERLTNEQSARRTRLEGIMRDVTDWAGRLGQARLRRDELVRRAEEAERLLAVAKEQRATPAEVLEEARVAAQEAQEASLKAAGDLDRAERHREACEERSRSLDGALATLREHRAVLIAGISQAQQSLRVVRDQISDRLARRAPVQVAAPAEVVPAVADGEASSIEAGSDQPEAQVVEERIEIGDEELLRIAGLQDGGMWPPVEAAEARHARFVREREQLGAVNFLAETELVEQEKRFGDLQKGREELLSAVKKLREAIAEIEAEARAKMQVAFHMIDGSFGSLFSRLFGGGQAHLRLIGDDILEAGLEIYASPPGKKMQILSLLSGGEQTLTAMALVFAAFLSNPAPICVLDEADAALDDSNTDRLIRLVEQMAQNDATRFLVITHSPLTMARMNRLYGVTMVERGVSMVTRVDLDRAVEIAGA